eukprot:1099351-Rhodomonas_salina.3
MSRSVREVKPAKESGSEPKRLFGSLESGQRSAMEREVDRQAGEAILSHVQQREAWERSDGVGHGLPPVSRGQRMQAHEKKRAGPGRADLQRVRLHPQLGEQRHGVQGRDQIAVDIEPLQLLQALRARGQR